MSTRDSPGGKGGRCVRLTTYNPCSAEHQEIRGLNLPGAPWAISTACCGRDLYLDLLSAMRGWGYLSRYGLGGPKIESWWGARFFAPVEIGLGAHPSSCTMGTGSFLGGKVVGAWR